MTQPPRAADTFLVSCIDPRLTDDTTFYFAALGRTDRYSEMRIAGAALAANEEFNGAWAQSLFENLAASRQLHGIQKVTFVNHRDCGAMHIWAGRRLSADPAEELRVHAEVLNRAAEAVRARHPDLLIEIKMMELDGTVRVLPCASCVPRGFRAEAVGPAARAVATASLGEGAVIAPPARAGTPRNPQGFAELARLRATNGAPDPAADLALLSRGVTEFGLTADEAQQALEAAAQAAGTPPIRSAERDTAAFLRSRQDRQGRIAREDVVKGAQLYRRLTGVRVTAYEAEQRTARLAETEGLAPRPEGIWPFRSQAWLRRMAEAPR
jgi:hypothetical protein